MLQRLTCALALRLWLALERERSLELLRNVEGVERPRPSLDGLQEEKEEEEVEKDEVEEEEEEEEEGLEEGEEEEEWEEKEKEE